jgi:outer membrane protein assembly factor BamB
MRRFVGSVRVIVLVAFAAVAADGAAQDAPEGVLAASTLPRLRRAWTLDAADLRTTQWRYEDTSPAFGGALFAWSTGHGASELVAIELATGKERWRIAAPDPETIQIEFATGMVLLNGASDTTAVDVKTGKPLWTAKLCRLSNHVRDNGSVGFALCHGPPDVWKSPGPYGSSSSIGTTLLLAFDLASGRALWRQQPWNGPNITVGARQVFVSRGKLVGLDARTGKEASQTAFPASTSHQPWAVAGADLGGKPLVLVNGGGDGRLTNRIAALEVPSGREVWTRSYPQGRFRDVRAAIPRDGRLFEWGLRELTEIDPGTGQVLLDCPLPRVHPTNNYPRRWRLMGGQPVVMMDAGARPPVVVRCEGHGGEPSLAQLPQSGYSEKLVAVEDGVIVVRGPDALTAYRVFETDPAESVALSPRERVQAILDRTSQNTYHTAESVAANKAFYDELRAVPGYGKLLLALAKQDHPTRQARAVDAATGLRVPGVVDLLLGEIFRAPMLPPTLTDGELEELNRQSQEDGASRAYARSHARRLAQIAMLAAMDDAKAADRLGPLLLARTTPAGLGWWDANIWGPGPGDHAIGAWDGASRGERRTRGQHFATEAGYSESLPATVGRAEAHAAIYRLLARRGRRADLARLDELHRATTRAGGWASICEADDAVKEPGPARVWVDFWGLCRGIDVGGGYLVTQSRNVVWVRRRLADGSFGPPAWADDPGGDQCLDWRIMQKAELRGGKIVVRGSHGYDHDSVLSVIDPTGLFADADGDGLTDRTEAAFGTDPRRADTDGDGVPDGRDPAPLAVPARDAAGEVTAEVLRFAALFLVGGPLALDGATASAGEGPSGAALLTGLPPGLDADDQVCETAGGRKRDEDGRPTKVRTPFPIARVEVSSVDGDRAQARFTWSSHSGSHAHELGLARKQGQWYVVDDRPASRR